MSETSGTAERVVGVCLSVSLGFLIAVGANTYNSNPVELSCTFNNNVIKDERLKLETSTYGVNLNNKFLFTREDGSTLEVDWTKPENKCTIVPRPKI